jgi:hypothetical protein
MGLNCQRRYNGSMRRRSKGEQRPVDKAVEKMLLELAHRAL